MKTFDSVAVQIQRPINLSPMPALLPVTLAIETVGEIAQGMFAWLDGIEREKTCRLLIEKQSELWLARIRTQECIMRQYIAGRFEERMVVLNALLPVVSRLAEFHGTEKLQTFLVVILQIIGSDPAKDFASFEAAWVKGDDIVF